MKGPVTSFVDSLARLVALDTVSPMDSVRIAACGQELARHGCRPVGERLFGHGVETADVWLYAHVDTKPVGALQEWPGDPFRLTTDSPHWVGLGVSDSKFQLLNALAAADPARHFVLVDTSEETDGYDDAAGYIAAHAPATLVICDGARDGADVHLGYSGQADGFIDLDTGLDPHHPARPGGDVSGRLSDLLAAVRESGLRFTLTGLLSPETERSLALQRARVRFDIRFDDAQVPAVRAFLSAWPHQQRQWMWPVAGGKAAPAGLDCGGPAPFSNRLGARGPLPVGRVVVVPGGDPDNRNHEPGEFIRPSQVDRHLRTLRRVLRILEEERDV